MRFSYSKWDESLFEYLKGLADLMAIFQYLLMRLNGDVDATLELMKQLQARGYLDSKYDIDEFAQKLKDSKFVKQAGSGLKLSAKGERSLRRDAFELIFERMKSAGKGEHPLPYEGGTSEELLPEKRPYSFGDNFRAIDYGSSMFNSISRTGDLGLNLSEDDLEVHEAEKTTSCATVLMIDVSHSMVLYGEDRITPAKQVAMAFTELIMTKYPRDHLSVVLFGDKAWEVKIADLPYIGAGPYHTNTQAGLRMARNILMGKKHVNKQIFMITDGKPSMITRKNGQLFKDPVGLNPIIVNRTLDEALICRKKKIPITTFMITDDPYLRSFVEKLTELNHGRAYFSSVNNLGNYVIWDFVSNRKKKGR
ncbi:MAG: VWA domain-containing protein [candidate division Zixibacteria bacterium]|nr:VWA domain-containing protein [candidate division Zixibacteria bacterium]